MTSQLRIWLTASASLAAAVLVLAAPASGADTAYTPFETDFPQAQPSASLDRLLTNERVHYGESTAVAPAQPVAPVQAETTAGGGFDWGIAGALVLGAGLVALVAFGLTRRSKRIAIAFIFVAGVASLAVTGIVAAGDDKQGAKVVSPAELVKAGWLCVDVPDNWVHCVPPGVDLEANPPESMLNLNFYTHDPNTKEALFLGEETLIRADVWKALPRQWPCGKKEYGFVPAEALPPYGYMYCHHFKEPKDPAPGGLRQG